MNLGLLLLRLLLATPLFGHGTQKLFGWFGDAGRAGTATVFDQWCLVPGRQTVVVTRLTKPAATASARPAC